MSGYLQLICKDCAASASYVATSEQELKYPFADDEDKGQARAAEAVEGFHERHDGHELEVIEA